MILRARGVWPVTQPFLENGAIQVADGRIQSVGPWPALRRETGGQAVDLGEVLLLPGLVNAHCHLDYTDMAGQLRSPKGFPDWIQGLVGLKASWSYSEYALSWLEGARMLLNHGVTTVVDIEAVPELLPEALPATPLRVIPCLELINVKNWHAARPMVAEAESRLAGLRRGPAAAGLSPHAPYTTSPELLRLAAESARRHRWLLTSHVAESKEEFEMFTRGRGSLFDWLAPQRDVTGCGGVSPVRFLARHGVMDSPFLAVHGNYLAEGDAKLLAARQASVVHCPRSHAFFRHQRFPLDELTRAGVTVCLGTDSLASVEAVGRRPLQLDLFAEMRALSAREPELSPELLVKMATTRAAKALGLEGKIGELSPGARADLIAIPFSGAQRNVAEAVLCHQVAVTASMIGGRWGIPPGTAARKPKGRTAPWSRVHPALQTHWKKARPES